MAVDAERAWDTSINPNGMIEALWTSPLATDSTRCVRRLRAWACACVRTVAELLTPEQVKFLVAAENLDGAIDEEQRDALQIGVAPLEGRGWLTTARYHARYALWLATAEMVGEITRVWWYTCQIRDGVWRPISIDPGKVEAKLECDLLHEVIGHPFRRISLQPHDLTPLIQDLLIQCKGNCTGAGYDPVRLAVLADALEDVGADQDLIDHLHSPGLHIRGCWGIDLLGVKGEMSHA